MAEDFLNPANFDFGQLLGIIQQRYPEMIPLLSKPGIFAALADGIKGGWTQQQIDSAVQNSEYFRTTPIGARQWDVLKATDPATATQRANTAGAMVRDTLDSLGVTGLTLDNVFTIINDVVTQGWDQTRLRYEVLNSFWAEGKGANQGDVAVGAAQFRRMGEEFGLAITDDSAMDWGRKMAAGQETVDTIRERLRFFAETTYPGIADFLHSGGTVKEFAQPYLELASRELGIPQAAMPLDDPKWSSLFLGNDDKGVQGVLSYAEAQKKIRSDDAYGYNYSPEATKQASTFASSILDMFGFAAQ